jgi:hypothetical protein
MAAQESKPEDGGGVSQPPQSTASAAAADGNAPLDDVMIAMDVVDTLRHDQLIVERELNEEERRAKLIERLREIYHGQGIEVPDRILEEGVKALEEDRFVYEPPRDTIQTRLARLYVSRDSWGRYALGAVGGVLAIWIGWYALYEVPRQRAVAARQVEINQTIPAEIAKLEEQIKAETGGSLSPASSATARRGLAAARAGNLTDARAARTALAEELATLQSTYEVRIVSRKGELSGLWRVPKLNPDARNYYLVVEAVGADGKVIPQTVLNEETGQSETVRKWAVRVPRDVLERARADKRADGIIDSPVVAVKRRGRMEPDWSIPLSGGEITRW